MEPIQPVSPLSPCGEGAEGHRHLDWYALYCRSNYERRVQAALSFHAIEEFTPLYQTQNHRKQTIFRPLLPGYLFARFDATNGCRSRVMSIPGMVRIVGDADPLPVPESQIEQVRQLVLCGLPVAPVAHCPVAEGQRVKVIRGPLQGAEGYVSYVKGITRVVISIEMLHRWVSAEVDATWLC